MNLIELFASTGSLSKAQTQLLSERLVTGLINAEGAPVEIVQRARDMTWLVVHEPQTWTVGGQTVTATGAPRFLVRLTMPGGNLDDAMRSELVSRAIEVIAEVVGDPDRFYKEPLVWVQIIEVPDGNLGAFGRVMRTADILELVVHGELPERGADKDPLVDRAIDPICGMTVSLTDDATVAEREGSWLAFCSTTCRDMFLAQRA